jgi:hypothetical protein
MLQTVLFLRYQQPPDTETLFAFPSLMARFGQQLAVFVFSHFFSAFLDDTTQRITSSQGILFLLNLNSITCIINSCLLFFYDKPIAGHSERTLK